MSAITIDPQLRTRLNNLTEPMELRESDGSIVGRFIPEEEYRRIQKELALAACPYTEEELARLRLQRKGGSLADFWKKQGIAS